jgi:hypothetical protein
MPRSLGVDIVRVNRKIKIALQARFEELGLTRKDVCEDAREKDFVIQQSALSRYMNNHKIVSGSLTHEQIMWLCCRYCVLLKLEVSKHNYSDVLGERLLNNYFPKGK